MKRFLHLLMASAAIATAAGAVAQPIELRLATQSPDRFGGAPVDPADGPC